MYKKQGVILATRKTNTLGKISGRLADTTTRIRYGKEVIYSLPDKVKVSNSPAAKTARNKFGLTVNFAKYINSIPSLSAVWKSADIPGVNSYQRLIKHNAKLTGKTSLTINNIITPPGNLSCAVNILYEDETITLELQIKMHSSFPGILHLVLYFYEPGEIRLNDFSLNYIQKEISELKSEGSIIITLSLNKDLQLLFEKYKHCILYSALTSSKNKNDWSSTFSSILKK